MAPGINMWGSADHAVHFLPVTIIAGQPMAPL